MSRAIASARGFAFDQYGDDGHQCEGPGVIQIGPGGSGGYAGQTCGEECLRTVGDEALNYTAACVKKGGGFLW